MFIKADSNFGYIRLGYLGSIESVLIFLHTSVLYLFVNQCSTQRFRNQMYLENTSSAVTAKKPLSQWVKIQIGSVRKVKFQKNISYKSCQTQLKNTDLGLSFIDSFARFFLRTLFLRTLVRAANHSKAGILFQHRKNTCSQCETCSASAVSERPRTNSASPYLTSCVLEYCSQL